MARRDLGVNGDARACDPFAVDEARWLERLTLDWGSVFLVQVNGGRWYASHRDGTGDAIIAATPGELAAAMGAAWHGNAR